MAGGGITAGTVITGIGGIIGIRAAIGIVIVTGNQISEDGLYQGRQILTP